MKKENKYNYYNSEDQVNFEKLDNFKKYNSNFKNKTQYKNQNIKYSNSDKNYFNSIIKTEKNISLLNETDIKKDINYYNSSDSQKFEQLNNFPEYKFDIKDKNESMNSEMIYSSNDYGEFNKIIQTNNKEEKTTKDKNKKVKVIDYGKLKEDEKKIKNKLGIEKIKIVYFD
tara:strand:+ start:723 stop:1235 length:513 start_codon:yes stop_codon:yes gene_type:complete